jgi:DNA gyrase subunit B
VKQEIGLSMIEENGQFAYDESSIQQLEGLEAVRKRPGMYIGDTSDGTGLHHMVFEVVDNAIDEALAGHCDDIVITIHADNSISVTDNGRGIPTGVKFDDKHEPKRSAAEIVMCVLHAGGKFNQNSYKVSGGLHGVGVSCVNALSKWLRLTIRRDGKKYQLEFNRGRRRSLIEDSERRRGFAAAGGRQIPRTRHRSPLHGRRRDLRPGRVSLRDHRQAPARTVLPEQWREDPPHRPAHRQGRDFAFLGGVKGFVEYINRSRRFCIRMFSMPAANRLIPTGGRDQRRSRHAVERQLRRAGALLHQQHPAGRWRHPHDRPACGHDAGDQQAISKSTRSPRRPRSISGDDMREGLACVLSVKMPDPKFASQTKMKLVSSEARPAVEEVVAAKLTEFLQERPSTPRSLPARSSKPHVLAMRRARRGK